jgi:Helix-turn-helix domain
MTWAMNLPKERLPSPTLNHVLLILANYADANGGSAFPSNLRLQKITKLDRRSIQRALRALEKKGLILRASKKIAALHISRSDKRPNAYTLAMEP